MLIVRIKYLLLRTSFGQWLLKSKIYGCFRTTMIWRDVYKGDNAAKYNDAIGKLVGKERYKLLLDMLRICVKYRFWGDEYIYFRFYERTDEEKVKFVSNMEHMDVSDVLNKDCETIIFDDKERTYQYFKDYYKRDVVAVNRNSETKCAFEQFLKKHSRFICKPNASHSGTGIRIVEFDGKSAKDLTAALLREYSGSFVAEELIKQNEQMASLHPESVNTIRIPAFRLDDGVKLIYPMLRMGRGKSCVDNAGVGGICGVVDMDSGEVLCVADEMAKQYTVHPDTGVSLIGWKVPRWEEAKELAAKLSQMVPGNRYVGWDLALTDFGWVIVEGNHNGAFLMWQMTLQKGFRAELEEILKEMKIDERVLNSYKVGDK